MSGKSIYRKSMRKHFLEKVMIFATASRFGSYEYDRRVLLENITVPEQNGVGEFYIDHMWVNGELFEPGFLGHLVQVQGTVVAYQKANGSYSYTIEPDLIICDCEEEKEFISSSEHSSE
ncbi:MAG: hypothetical protein IJK53_08315 [Erysipelotrichaceae bacterium]|nr:hypothetical protein [Erysipelotrichaceae bacterium]